MVGYALGGGWFGQNCQQWRNCPKHSRFGEILPDLLEISLDSVRSC